MLQFLVLRFEYFKYLLLLGALLLQSLLIIYPISLTFTNINEIPDFTILLESIDFTFFQRLHRLDVSLLIQVGIGWLGFIITQNLSTSLVLMGVIDMIVVVI